jgi:hypothetical protein
VTPSLRGAGGYGKTTLAKALAHDRDVQDAYFDGILWVELGEKPGNLLSIISDLIEILSGERPGLENIYSAAAKLGEALGDRHVLMVVDHVWREQDLRPFMRGGHDTTRLVTTRNDNTLPANAVRQRIDAIKRGQALSLAFAGVNRRLDERGLAAFDARNEADRTKAVARKAQTPTPKSAQRSRAPARAAGASAWPRSRAGPSGACTYRAERAYLPGSITTLMPTEETIDSASCRTLHDVQP